MPVWWAPMTAVLTFVAVACARWLWKAMSKSFAESVNEMVSPEIKALHIKLDLVQADNKADHKIVAHRLAAVEFEVERLKNSVVKLQGITEEGFRGPDDPSTA